MEISLHLTSQEALLVAQRIGHLAEEANSDEERAALEKTVVVLAEASETPEGVEQATGFIDWTLDDESYEPFGRQFDVRVYYHWVDFDAGDRTTPAFGGYAEIVDIEVTSVRYFDEHGEAVSAEQQNRSAAWELVTKESSHIEAACTRAGSVALEAGTRQGLPLALRAAPSARQRSAQSRQRASG